MEEETPKKNSNIAGIPYIVIIFVIVATLPNLVSDMYTRAKVAEVKTAVIDLEATRPVLPTVTLTPALTPSATPEASLKSTNTVATPTVKAFVPLRR